LRDSFAAASPRKADHIISTLRSLIGWGIPREYADTNPCAEIRKLYHSDGYAPWEWPDVVYGREHLPPRLWHAAALALYTGQRQSDVLAMNWHAIDSGAIAVKQQKTGKPLTIPLHRDLRAILDDIPKTSIRIRTNSYGQPWTADGFKTSWRKVRNGPAFAHFRERGLVFHGLRKSAVVLLLEAGCTVPETASITGQSWKMVEHYAIMVNQRKLARTAVMKWESANDA
jgi:integrase